VVSGSNEEARVATMKLGGGGWLAVAFAGALQQAPPAAKVPRFEPQAVTVGDGPLLLLSRRDTSTGEPVDRWDVVAPDVRLEAQPFLRLIGDLEPIGRVSPGVIVVRSHGMPRGLVALDLVQARATPFGDVDALDVDGRGAITFACDPPQDHHLDGKDRGIARLVEVPFDGGAPRTIVALPHGVERNLLRTRVSPDGRHVAWSYPWDAEGMPGASLTVVDRASGRIVRSWSSIDVAIAPESSSIALLEFAWLDEKTLRYGDSEGGFRWVDVEIAGGTTVAIHPVGPLGLAHGEPPLDLVPPCAGLRATRGLFEVGDDKLWFLGDSEPIVDARTPLGAQSAWFRVAPGGRFALLEREEGLRRDTLLLIGGTRQRVLLGDAATRAWGWLTPAAAK